MPEAIKLSFVPFSGLRGVLVVFCGQNLKFGPATQKALAPTSDFVRRAAAADHFTGKNGSVLDLVAPAGLNVPRLIVVGTGKDAGLKSRDIVKLGGVAMGRLPAAAATATLFAELPSGALKTEQVADLALGVELRAYRFERYKTKRKEDDERPAQVEVSIACANSAGVQKAWSRTMPVADGVVMARDLINEPANVLYPAEFARRASALSKLGVVVEVFDVAAMKKLGMGALLGVGQGSAHDSKLVVMRWNGGKRTAAPIAFIGKGVCFDTGGISIKPAQGMEDMKGDMAGAACVVGLMHALAARKAKVNAVGAIGLVENMPDGKAQRPGDIVKTMSGQTIEIINTDAEGRLVLADALAYGRELSPDLLVDNATLTGACVVALGTGCTGWYASDEDVAREFGGAIKQSGEQMWRMPLLEDLREQIKSEVADVKQAGDRHGGSITAALFLREFAGTGRWVHCDIAGPAHTDRPHAWMQTKGASGHAVLTFLALIERASR